MQQLLPCTAFRRPRAPFSIASKFSLVQPNGLCKRRAQIVATRAESEGSSAAAAKEEEGDLLIERQLASRRRKPKESKERPKVISAVRDQVYGGGPLTAEQAAENRAVQALSILFFIILGEGLFLGASGFMSEAADQFAQDVVYKLFSPSIALFLAGSSAYGLWKTYFQGRGGASKKEE